jgi:hypothetical protein
VWDDRRLLGRPLCLAELLVLRIDHPGTGSSIRPGSAEVWLAGYHRDHVANRCDGSRAEQTVQLHRGLQAGLVRADGSPRATLSCVRCGAGGGDERGNVRSWLVERMW